MSTIMLYLWSLVSPVSRNAKISYKSVNIYIQYDLILQIRIIFNHLEVVSRISQLQVTENFN